MVALWECMMSCRPFSAGYDYSRGALSDSHELAMFLELYNANPWTRTTGELATFSCISMLPYNIKQDTEQVVAFEL